MSIKNFENYEWGVQELKICSKELERVKVDSPSTANQKTCCFLKTPDYQNTYLINQP